jgi:hypothetical protein
VEYQVRDARLTDVEQVCELIQRADQRWTADRIASAADLLRQLVYLPSASVLVALAGRQVDGVAVLSLRPSVAAGGFIGAIDLLAIEPGRELGGPVEPLLREIIRSARNKGCVLVEAAPPVEPALSAAMERAGFAGESSRVSLSLQAARVAAR